jgi:protein-disulfide isomerase
MVFSICFAGLAQAGQDPSLDKQAIRAIVEELLLEKPQIIVESHQKFMQKRSDEEDQKSTAHISKRLKESPNLLTISGTPTFKSKGKSKEKIHVFVSPYCGHCQEFLKQAKTFSENNPDYHIEIFLVASPKDLASNSLAKALAALAQMDESLGLFSRFFNKVRERVNPLEQENILKIATLLGVKEEEFKSLMESPKVEAYLSEVNHAAKELQISGYPTFLRKSPEQKGSYPKYMTVSGFPNTLEALKKALELP